VLALRSSKQYRALLDGNYGAAWIIMPGMGLVFGERVYPKPGLPQPIYIISKKCWMMARKYGMSR
jgi:hypothetical protein